MNLQIIELAKQAGFIDRGNNHTAYMNFDHEKFAELIVQQCITILENSSAMKVDEHTLSTLNLYNQGWVNGRKLAIEHIKTRFGVEE